MVKSQVAKSLRLSFTGNQLGVPCGSFTTNAPSSVGIQPSFDVVGVEHVVRVARVDDANGEVAVAAEPARPA